MQTPNYDPADLNPAAATASHTHTHTHPSTIVIGIGAIAGALVANPPDLLRIRNHWGVTFTLTELHYEVRSAPAGSQITIELRRNGAVVHTGSIVVGATRRDYTGLAIAWADDDSLEMVPTQVGSTTAGSTLIGMAVGTTP